MENYISIDYFIWMKSFGKYAQKRFSTPSSLNFEYIAEGDDRFTC